MVSFPNVHHNKIIMDRLVPTFILDHYTAAEQDGGLTPTGSLSGRLTAACLFIDLVGFSDITDALMEHGQHGAEVLAAVMRDLFDPLVCTVYEQGGFITGFAGDAFTALFLSERGERPAPAALAALAAAWRIARRVREQPAYDTAYGDFPISVKAGLSLGSVEWGIVTDEDGRRASFYFAGPAIDGATSAQEHARPGDVILHAALHRALESDVQTDPLPDAGADYARLTAVHGDLPPALSPDLPEPEPDLLARFLGRDVVDRPVSGEFRQVVSVAMSLPTVRTTADLAIFARTIFTLQEQYGGLLNRLDFGDKGAHLVLFWGAPIAHENDVERALNFILDLQGRTAIPLNAGVTYHIAHAGPIGGRWRSDYTCYGRGINLATRFMTTAARGDIWVDENVARRAAAHFDLAFEGRMPFKGFAEPQKVYALLERKESAEPLYQGPLVGRQEELQQLAAFLRPLSDDRSPGLLVVWGEAGIGKSRLLHTLRHGPPAYLPAGALWAFCQTDEILRRSLNPFRYWLRRYFGLSAALSEARNKRAFNRRLDNVIAAIQEQGHRGERGERASELASELDAARSFLGALVDLRWPDSLYEQLDAQARYENTLTALAALLRAESLRQPVVVLLEDAHWLDEDTGAFLPRILQTLSAGETAGRAHPIAVIATTRPDSAALPLDDVAYDEIHLRRLDADHLARLVRDLLGGPAAPALLDLVAGRAEGNPFFAGQIVHFLQEEGRLQPTPAGWDLAAPTGAPGDREAAFLPADVRAILAARLDRLPPAVREVVETAAVLGREFELRLLARMVGDGEPQDETFQSKIKSAEQAGVWSPLEDGRRRDGGDGRGDGGDGGGDGGDRYGDRRYLFHHALLRDTAYRTQTRARRQTLHARAVDALESLHAADPAGHVSELAHHSERANLVDKARRYLRLAGDDAAADYQNALALDYYQRALALTPEGDREARYELHLAREAIFRLRGEQEERQQTLQTLADLAGALDDGQGAALAKATVTLRRAIYAHDAADYARAVALCREAADLAHRAGPPLAGLPLAGPPAVLLEAQQYRATALMRQARLDEAAELAKSGRDLARQAGDRGEEAYFLNLLGMITLDQERPEAAGDYFARSLACAREAGDRRRQAQILNNLGNLHDRQGDYAAAQSYYQQALVIAREIGERAGEGLVLGNLGYTAALTGDHDTARSYYAQALRINRETGDRLGETYNLINLSASHLWATAGAGGEGAGEAGRCATDALEMARETGDRSAEAWALTYLGHCCLEGDDHDGAAEAYAAALAIRRDLQQEALAAEPAAGVAAVHLAQGDPDAALACLEDVLPLLDGRPLEGADDPLRVYLVAYRALAAAGDARAPAVLEKGHALLHARAARIADPDLRRAFLQGNPGHRALLTAYEKEKAP